MNQASRKSAFHEAGHAVLASACGFQLLSVNIISTDGRDGQTQFRHPRAIDLQSEQDERDLYKKLAIVGVAGAAAEYADWCTEGQLDREDASTGHFRDEQAVLDELEKLGLIGDNLFQSLVAVVSKFLLRKEVWFLLADIASTLIRTQKLSTEDIHSFVERSSEINLNQIWTEFEALDKA